METNNQDLQPPKFAIQWTWNGLTEEDMNQKIAWLEEPRKLGSGCGRFFQVSARLFSHARYDCMMASPAFFHAVIGLERALRIHYKSKDETYSTLSEGNQSPFVNLLKRALEDRLVFEDGFEHHRPIPVEFLERLDPCPADHAGRLACLVPLLRNEYFHGSFRFSPYFFFLALQLRGIADELKTKGERSLID